MPVASPHAIRDPPRWYLELNLGVGLIVFAAITVYPWFGTTSELALAVATCVSIAGAVILMHSVRLGRRVRWRWLKMDTTDEKVAFLKERRTTAAIIVLLMLAAVYGSLDLSTPTLALRFGWWAIMAVCATFSFLIYVGWRARN
jgi:hypothetical protein